MLEDDTLLERMSAAAYDGFWQCPPTIEEHVRHLEIAYRSIFAETLNRRTSRLERKRIRGSWAAPCQ